MSKITELCTHRHRHACSHTHGVENQRISSDTYLREHRERLAREDMEIRSDQDVGIWGLCDGSLVKVTKPDHLSSIPGVKKITNL